MIRWHRMVIGAALAAAITGATTGETSPASPVRIFALIDRPKPEPPAEWFSRLEYTVMAERFGRIAGPDGGGLDFPGPVDELTRRDPDATVLAQLDAMAVFPHDPRFAALDPVEDVFIHSADPASLTASMHGGRTVLWFRQDVRARQIAPGHTPPGVIYYAVEWSAGIGDPWMPLAAVIENGEAFHRVEDPVVDLSRRYRVRARLADNSFVDYSGIVSVDPFAGTWIGVASLDRDGAMLVLAYGDAPADPSLVAIEADFDNDKVFGAGERLTLGAVEPAADGGMLYSGSTADPRVDRPLGFRAAIDDVRLPEHGSYQIDPYNNRVQLRQTGALLLWPSHSAHVQQMIARLDEAMALGYAGMRLDNAFDTLEITWGATGVPPDWIVGSGDPRIVDGVEALLVAIGDHRPDAMLAVNGRWTVAAASSFFDRYMPHADAGDIEFFGIGDDPDSTVLQGDIGLSLAAVWTLRAMGRDAVCLAGATETNGVARIKALAMYLLCLGDGVWFYNEHGGAAEAVAHLPEWDVPLGPPVGETTGVGDLIDPHNPALLSRRFEHGRVVVNNSLAAQPVDLGGQTVFRLAVTGGDSSLLGGDGLASYRPIATLTLASGEAAILIDRGPFCLVDVTGDGRVNMDDLYVLHALPSDVNGDGLANEADITCLRAALRWAEPRDVAPSR